MRRLVPVALLLTFVVIVFGAFVRLSDAGLGCPDWPGCYGKLSPHAAAASIAEAQAAAPQGPVSLPKAWKEMIHRYLAGSLGLILLTLAVAALAGRLRGRERALALALVGVVALQALLGRWTVTLLLKPAIVTSHLLGGMTVLALLTWMWRVPRQRALPTPRGLRLAARLGLALLVLQIALGGWTSTNYAALACGDFPTCQGAWMPDMDFANAFHLFRELGYTADGELLSLEALRAIHWTHRLVGMSLAALLLGLALALLRRPGTRGWGLALGAAVCVQVGLGIANVLGGLPLPVAVAHNAGAGLLLATMTALNLQLAPLAVRARRAAPAIRAGEGGSAGPDTDPRGASARPALAGGVPRRCG